MAGIAELTLAQAREKMAAKGEALNKVFEEAKTSDGSIDFNKVTVLGADVKGSIAVAEKVKQMNAELTELGEHADKLAEAEKALTDHQGRQKARGGFRLPGLGGNGGFGEPENKGQFQIKSIGELIAESKTYKDWGGAGGIDLTFDDVWLSDLLVKAQLGDTLAAKALMTTSAGYARRLSACPASWTP